MLECVVNISEGRRRSVLQDLVAATGGALIDLHHDAHHNRSVFTLAGPDVENAARALATRAVAELEISSHQGVHPRIGVVDVAPFVPLEDSHFDEALAARDRFGQWIGQELKVPAYRYGPERSLPEVRRAAGIEVPDWGPPLLHPTAGGCAVGARQPLVAYNLWLANASLATAKAIAKKIRRPTLRTLGLQVGDEVQVSCNLIDPLTTGPAVAYDAVAAHADIARAELVGLLPVSVLERQPCRRWTRLDLSEERTIKARLELHGLR